MTDAVTLARMGLLDALEALERHLGALVVIGAQAVYLHTGATQIALAEFTTDGDIAVDPSLLSSDPLMEGAMTAAGFTPDPRGSAVGSWISPRGVPVDLMVPEALAGSGRRGVRVPPHSRRSMRRARGIEASMVDNSPMVIGSLEPSRDGRAFEVSVAGPAALLVAKLHKLHDRVDSPSRRDNKDAHDVYRLLQAIETPTLAASLESLLHTHVSEAVTREALVHLRQLFGDGPDALGSSMAGAAEELVGDPAGVSASVALLSQDLLTELGR
ncbi:GSU2403 family nucleotidyltransferase fold protein [Aestuariimicrobium soli]|uniref:GSU2403 family nucleotidyltransferase fold protein n=1 Tax=Aestuariimicrobium soli TaxID=2035834 RepID=UPI003EBB5C8E